MNYEKTNSYGQDIYSYVIPADVTGVVFNAGKGKDQTVDITEGFANVVTLSLTDAELSFEEGSCVYSSTTGLRASALIPSASETFVTNAIGDVTSPTQGTEPTTVPVTEEPVDKTDFVTTATADTEKATSASDSSAVDYDAVATGRSIGFISVFTILIGAFAVIVIVKRKKQI